MRLLITMNMPARAGTLVHQVYAEYDCSSLEAFLEILLDNDFLIVEEFYRDKVIFTKFDSVGNIILNCRYIGKVKEWHANGTPRP